MSTTDPHPSADSSPPRDNSADSDLIALQIQQARQDAGLSVQELSRLTGISKTVLHGYERGRTKPGAREIRILSIALKVSPNKLVHGNDVFETDRPTLTSLYRKMKVRPGLSHMLALMYIPYVTAFLDEDELRSLLGVTTALLRAKHPTTGTRLLVMADEMAEALDAHTLPDGTLTLPPEQLQALSDEVARKVEARMRELATENG